jgi:two-component system, chemotaxis family, chemotaxis protein CheY
MAIKILIVDDSSLARKIMRKSLPQGLTAEVIETSSGKEAVGLCTSQSINVMFLDLTMPDFSGFDVLEALQSVANRPRVIVVSGDVQTLAQQRVKALGATCFVKKPAAPEAIHAALTAVGVV